MPHLTIFQIGIFACVLMKGCYFKINVRQIVNVLKLKITETEKILNLKFKNIFFKLQIKYFKYYKILAILIG